MLDMRRNPRFETEQPCNGVRLRKRDGSRLERSHQFEEQGGQLDRDSLWRGRLWPWWQHRDETSLCEAGRFVYILLIGVDISERSNGTVVLANQNIVRLAPI